MDGEWTETVCDHSLCVTKSSCFPVKSISQIESCNSSKNYRFRSSLCHEFYIRQVMVLFSLQQWHMGGEAVFSILKLSWGSAISHVAKSHYLGAYMFFFPMEPMIWGYENSMGGRLILLPLMYYSQEQKKEAGMHLGSTVVPSHIWYKACVCSLTHMRTFWCLRSYQSHCNIFIRALD